LSRNTGRNSGGILSLKILPHLDGKQQGGSVSFVTNRSHRNIGLNVTEEEYQGHLERNSIFKKWFTKHVMAETGPLSDTILVVPFGIAEPIYIDEPPQ
jgi:hypothetical protein